MSSAENAPRSEVGKPEGSSYSEDEAPQEGKIHETLKINANIELRRWFALGIGILITMTILLSFGTAFFRPDLVGQGFIKELVQLTLGALLAAGGTAVGFLFGKES